MTGRPAFGFTYPALAAIREAGVFERVGATWLGAGDLLVNHDGIADSVYPAFVTHDVLPGLGVRLQAGRHFTADEDRRGAAPVLLLSDRAWRRTFAADPRIVGRTIRLGASAATIVGIVAPGFRGLSLGGAPDVFVPLHAIADVTDVPMNYFADTNHVSSPTAGVRIIGRLRDGITPAQAAGRLDSLPATVPGLERGGARTRLGLTPLDVAARTGATKAGLVTFARLLAATVSLTLLVGCGTVALLLFVRVEARRAELATCIALGASAARLVRGFALEAAAVAGAGALAALPASWWLLRGLRAFELPGGVSVAMLDAGIDARAIGVALASAIAAVATVTCGDERPCVHPDRDRRGARAGRSHPAAVRTLPARRAARDPGRGRAAADGQRHGLPAQPAGGARPQPAGGHADRAAVVARPAGLWLRRGRGRPPSSIGGAPASPAIPR